MKLYFKVPPEADGMLLRGFLRKCSVSTDLSRAVKFRGSGFFADGAPILANRRVEKVEDVVNIGDMIWVKVTEIDEKGRVNLSYKDALKELENNPGLKK